MLPKISIVVPSYNQGHFLEETIVSILDENYPDLELFVVDGGSTDKSVEVIKKFENRITWWVSEKDKGQSNAINKGLKHANGDILTWINSDDYLTPGSLHSVAKYFNNAESDIGLIHGGVTLFREEKIVKEEWGYPQNSVERYLAGMAFSQPSAFFKRTYFEQAGGKVSEDLHYGMDYDLFSRLALICKFLPVPHMFAKYRLHEESKSVANQDKFIRDWSKVFINLCKNLHWQELITELRSVSPILRDVDYFNEFTFRPHEKILTHINKKKLMFYHLCYHVKASYLANRFDEARKMLKWLTNNYDSDWLAKENSIPPIMRNLKFPDFIIRLMQKLKTAS